MRIPPLRQRRQWALWGVVPVVVCLSRLHATGPAGASPEQVQARAIYLPLYAADQTTLAAVVRVAVARKDYQRRGFYRIGLLPVLVLEDVTIEVSREREFQQVLVLFEEQLRRLGRGQTIELRRTVFSFLDEAQPRLRADSGRLQPDGQWRLQGNVQFTAGKECIRAVRAWLTPVGPEAGLLRLQTAEGVQVENLFSCQCRTTNHLSVEGTP